MTPKQLVEYAKSNRWRVRNINDGYPLPPMKRKGQARMSDGYSRGEAEWAIIGRYGYVTAEGAAIGWALLCPHGASFNCRIHELALLGTVRQRCDIEAAGYAPDSAINDVARIIGVYRLPKGASAEALRSRFSTQTASGAV